MFSYENKTKTNFENKENEFTIFNILYINQKTVLCCFPYFLIKSKTRDFVDWDKNENTGFFFSSFYSLFVFHFDFLLIRLTKTQDYE